MKIFTMVKSCSKKLIYEQTQTVHNFMLTESLMLLFIKFVVYEKEDVRYNNYNYKYIFFMLKLKSVLVNNTM